MEYELIIFDADDTLRRTTVPGQPCPDAPDEWELLPQVAETLTKLERQGVVMGVASNQGGVAEGYLSEAMARQLLEDMVRAALGHGLSEGSVQMCPHTASMGCECRKPSPLMLERIMDTYGISPDVTLFVGDMETDRQAAENAGCDFIWARDFFDWQEGEVEE